MPIFYDQLDAENKLVAKHSGSTKLAVSLEEDAHHEAWPRVAYSKVQRSKKVHRARLRHSPRDYQPRGTFQDDGTRSMTCVFSSNATVSVQVNSVWALTNRLRVEDLGLKVSKLSVRANATFSLLDAFRPT
jgi:hypothetical protein